MPRPLNQILNAKREALSLSYEDVYERLQAYPWPAGVEAPGLSTVGHWFNGTRRPRDMDHLRALCGVLELRIAEAMDEAPGEAKTDLEANMLAELRRLSPETVLVLLAMARKMHS